MHLTTLRRFAAIAAVCSLAGCGSDSEPAANTPEPAPAAKQQSITIIDQETFGAEWPFTQPEMHLACLQGSAVVVMDVNTGAMYPVNGIASGKANSMAMEPLESVWLDSTEFPGTKVSVGPVIERGLALCN
ncbi:DUF2511 domain-containing protein [Pseudomonas sp.]|uniref:DUF2511 domain-containing protein n=1 Tax=Pseudomonas sp. TaxID=306 RepID=UPI0032422F99